MDNNYRLDEKYDGNLIQQIVHPKNKDFESHQIEIVRVIRSWTNAFTYKKEVILEDGKVIEGLRSPQIGALHAIQAHLIVSKEPATIVLPTGTGKTETMISAMVANQARKVLVIVPSEPLRTQLAQKFLSLGILQNLGVISETAHFPIVGTLLHIPKTQEFVDQFFRKCQVVVATAQLLSQCDAKILKVIATYCDYLFVDEAHHREAISWSNLIRHFEASHILQFTATPYRNDDKPLTGKIIFNYPLRQAQREKYFTHINFVHIQEFHPNIEFADAKIAKLAVQQLNNDIEAGLDHLLMARVNKIERAVEVFKHYEKYKTLNPVMIHSNLSASERVEIRDRIINKKAKIIICVDMLGEGFDLPELKVAAFHDVRQSLPVTLQLAGRFTRFRKDLGEATVFANIAHPPDEQSLQELYSQNPDWNHILRVTSENKVQKQIDLKEFVDGFVDMQDNIPLQSVRIKMSTAIYKTFCDEWSPNDFKMGLQNPDQFNLIAHDVNSENNVLIVLTVQKIPIPWIKNGEYNSLEMKLYVAFWDREQELLFINHSENNGYYLRFAKAIAKDVELIKGNEIFRCLEGITRLKIHNLGTREERGRLISYMQRAGSNIGPAYPTAQRKSASKVNIFGGGFESGAKTTIGCSSKGRIWSARQGSIDEYIGWCKVVGAKVINEEISPDKILEGTIIPQPVVKRPSLVAIAVDWNESIYERSERFINFYIDGQKMSLYMTDIQLCETSIEPDKLLDFDLISENVTTKLRMHLYEDSRGPNFNFENLSGNKLTVKVSGRSSVLAENFFQEFPPKFIFLDGSSLVGNEFMDLKQDLPPYPVDKIQKWDWSSVDIKKESQGIDKKSNTIQYHVIHNLLKDSYDVVFDDDGSGESADIVTIRNLEKQIHVEFYHCKYSMSATAGKRIGDLYEVCGQAQKSIRWASDSTKLFEHLLARSKRGTKNDSQSWFERGDEDLLASIYNKSRRYPTQIDVYIVQPGLAANPSQDQLELLSVTENHLMETYKLPFWVIGNKGSA